MGGPPRVGRLEMDVTPEPVRLTDRLERVLAQDDPPDALARARPRDRHDAFTTLRRIHELHTGSVSRLGRRLEWQHHPEIARCKGKLEEAWLRELDARVPAADPEQGTAGQLSTLAARDRSPAVYRWIAEEASWDDALRFLALEGGPDDVFDDLVAICQVGLPLGPAKMELAHNYWDEMGNGDFEAVHNVLYRRFVQAVELPSVPDHEQPVEALERSALLGLLATNRVLQPEMIGALGLIELEAGPHCRFVERGLERLEAPEGAHEFYAMHAEVDPLHGRGWLDNAVGPLVAQLPEWGPRILRGAHFKSTVNAALFDWAERELMRRPVNVEDAGARPSSLLDGVDATAATDEVSVGAAS